MQQEVKKIFILSMPRSGSTYLQRRLCEAIGSKFMPESWYLIEHLALLSGNKKIRSIYGSYTVRDRLSNLFLESQESRDRYLERIRKDYDNFILDESDGNVFVDKVPRYICFYEELLELFPDALFIVLVRDPVRCLISCIDEYRKNGFDWYDAEIDFAIGQGEGLPTLLNKYKNDDRFFFTRYESLDDDFEFMMEKVNTYCARAMCMDPVLNQDDSSDKCTENRCYSIGARLREREFKVKNPSGVSFVDYVLIYFFVLFNVKRNVYEALGYSWKKRFFGVTVKGLGIKTIFLFLCFFVKKIRDYFIYR